MGTRISVDEAAHRILVDGTPVPDTTDMVFRLVRLLAQQPASAMSTDAIARALWSDEDAKQNVQGLVRRARAQLSHAGHNGAELILTRPGFGYALAQLDAPERRRGFGRTAPLGVAAGAVLLLTGAIGFVLDEDQPAVPSDGSPSAYGVAPQAAPPPLVTAVLDEDGDQVVLWRWEPGEVSVELRAQDGRLVGTWMHTVGSSEEFTMIPLTGQFYEAGQVLTVSAGGRTEDLTVVELELQADLERNLVSGRAPASAVVRIAVNCGRAACELEEEVTAEADGTFRLDLAEYGHLAPGRHLTVTVANREGDRVVRQVRAPVR